jgi:homocitrate synthase NifV
VDKHIKVSDMKLLDTTLRDGEQAAGVAFSDDEKVRLAYMLDEMRIDEMEIGTPAMGAAECAVIRKITRAGLNARLTVWCRAMTKDIDAAAATDVEGVHIAFPVSDIQLNVFNKSRQWLDDILPTVVEYARRRFSFVSVGAQDACRAKPEQLHRFLLSAQSNAAERVRISDTVGIMTPLHTAEMFGKLRREFPDLQFDFHAHNDFGMATANAITAWQSGAQTLSVTVGGLGERAGNAAMEEIMLIGSQRFDIKKYDTSRIYELCRYVSGISRRPIPVAKPITGDKVLSHESGIHIRGTLADVLSFQPFDGKTVGRKTTEICSGKHSGKRTLIIK